MTILEQVNLKIVEAMKNRDTVASNAYKGIKSEIMKASHSGESYNEIKILQKMQAQHKDSIEQYEKANRNDLVDIEKRELEIIESFLPAQASEAEVEAYTKEVASAYENLSMKNMKEILGKVQEKYPTASGAIVSKVVKTLI